MIVLHTIGLALSSSEMRTLSMSNDHVPIHKLLQLVTSGLHHVQLATLFFTDGQVTQKAITAPLV